MTFFLSPLFRKRDWAALPGRRLKKWLYRVTSRKQFLQSDLRPFLSTTPSLPHVPKAAFRGLLRDFCIDDRHGPAAGRPGGGRDCHITARIAAEVIALGTLDAPTLYQAPATAELRHGPKSRAHGTFNGSSFEAAGIGSDARQSRSEQRPRRQRHLWRQRRSDDLHQTL
jgi:hypothetical protein